MKVWTRILALINILWFLAIVAFNTFYQKETLIEIINQTDLLLILAVFLILAIGFLVKSKLAWTLNFIWGSLIVSGMVAAIISGMFKKNDTRAPTGTNEIIVLAAVTLLTSLTAYSLIQSLKSDMLNEMKVGRNQKRITLGLTFILVCIWILK